MWCSSDLFVYANGLVYCSVCCPKEMPQMDVERFTNTNNPSGVNSWTVVNNDFDDGSKNPHQCEKYPKEQRLHYLLSC